MQHYFPEKAENYSKLNRTALVRNMFVLEVVLYKGCFSEYIHYDSLRLPIQANIPGLKSQQISTYFLSPIINEQLWTLLMWNETESRR
ncbi:hypothetical protein TNCT_475801 [Trichonephila clavata]|uniref:Uncharacterized protein n=1 Tax=Trichonephila clavata TaxID=2740835 RepID=A0A8X6G4S1_TRICU|nr:hypothetical protein TNCT_475801 [Trichonephila clavata]